MGDRVEPAQAYAREIIEKAKRIRLPELFLEPNPQAYYQRINRNGVSCTAIAQSQLTGRALRDLLLFRLANTLAYGHVDTELIYSHRAEFEWWFPGGPDDVLLFAGSSETGEIGSHTALAFLSGGTAEMTLRDADRPLFEVEQMYGRDLFLHMPVLPDLPLNRLVEPRRLVKTYWLDPLNELAFRAAAELGVASFHAMIGPLRSLIDAVLGDVTREAERNLDFFGTPFSTLPDARPLDQEAPIFHPPREDIPTRPMALLVSEVAASAARTQTIEAALELPGRECLLALIALGAAAEHQPSALLAASHIRP